MWSKRRKKFARKYDWQWHQFLLYLKILRDDFNRRMAEEVEYAILYGYDAWEEKWNKEHSQPGHVA